MTEVLATDIVGGLLGGGLGVGLGLLMNTRSARAWAGMVLVVVASVALTASASPPLLLVIPAFALTFGTTVTFVEAHTRRHDPLLSGESFPRRVALIFFHSKGLRDAVQSDREHHFD